MRGGTFYVPMTLLSCFFIFFIKIKWNVIVLFFRLLERYGKYNVDIFLTYLIFHLFRYVRLRCLQILVEKIGSQFLREQIELFPDPLHTASGLFPCIFHDATRLIIYQTSISLVSKALYNKWYFKKNGYTYFWSF